ncbi:FAD-dependent monooxygenase [Nocardia sp. NRRL WC-3656]|uniref:FAD-dependent monooxygenase n=1 Tax=Nocardia sp. NRRL WC-3656 TaxID=1463824 RepID=UPI0004C2E655|nr:FAD-dependent monooxygenase [Nocardia sp. NRRL WC-3656]
MKVLVSGGGIAGLTCAYWLHRHGHTPVVVERAGFGPLGGYGIDFSGTGYDIADRMGLLDSLAARQLRAEDLVYVDRSGKVTARLKRPLVEKVLRGPYLALMHTTLEEALAEAVSGSVEIRYRHSIADVRQSSSAVDVTFSDGQCEQFDILVGADGVNSSTRVLLFGPNAQYARNIGYKVACYPVSDVPDFERVRAHYTESGRQTVVYATDVPGESVAVFLYSSRNATIPPRAERAHGLRTAYAGAGWVTEQLLDAAPAEGFFMDNLTQIRMPTWRNGRTVLIGDACGAMTLASAQGTSLAMAGGYLLACALRDHHNDPDAAFAAYESRLRPVVTARQNRARAFARSLVPPSRVGVATQRLITRLMLHDSFAPLLRLGFGNTASILPPLAQASP